MSKWSWSSTGNEVVAEYAEKIKGRVFLITGPSDGGIGAETALCLASQSPSTLILAGRNKAKIQPVIDKITQLSPDVKSIFVELDLSSQTSVRSAAAEINAQVEHIDVLINNAAIMACPFSQTEDNLEIQFGTNFIGPFLFTGLLLPKIRAAGPGARIVNVSSSAHRFEGIRFDDLDFGGGSGYDTWKAYGQSKTALILMAIQIANKIPRREVSAFSVHPGILDYEVTDRKSLQQGCSTSLIAALDPSLTGESLSMAVALCAFLTFFVGFRILGLVPW
ncbi:unnamed protein product [Penicillium salamii]|uniref:NAD(P)-binding protein n=1 Tax=Penicillium salamii TaxID=1612424 RepID=A0A9W4JKD7_9EURO|nr:unnamed protein product [Penicillium salamii]CAG8051283.1 unnamed protein product [Penicillium salamii]CAG8165259.1 unnamed protein product [Penicillium salamii]CAG8206718.1 unnamed protein product [Penicillium salamii]CAG8233657.1 unnamed protein product [Penicillium salamii]